MEQNIKETTIFNPQKKNIYMYKYDLMVIKRLSMTTRAPKLPNQNTVIIGCSNWPFFFSTKFDD